MGQPNDTPLGLELIQQHTTRPVLIVETPADQHALVKADCVAAYAADWLENVAFVLGRSVVLIPRTEAWAERTWWQLAGSTSRQRIIRLPSSVAETVRNGKDALSALVTAAWKRPPDDPAHAPAMLGKRPQAGAQEAAEAPSSEAEPKRAIAAVPETDEVAKKRAEKAKRAAERAEKLAKLEAAGMFPWKGKPWADRIIYSASGYPKALQANVALVLREDPAWKGVLTWDLFARTIRVMRDSPGGTRAGLDWSDVDDMRTTEWVQRQGVHAPESIVSRAVTQIANEQAFHPLQTYLQGLTWDRQERLDDFLIEHCGADPTPIVRAMTARWMIGAVKRAFEPGCINRAVLILEGPQEIGKSQLFRVLAGADWFTDDVPMLGGKDTSQLLNCGTWIVELAELVALWRTDQHSVKAFISRQVDHFRVPYDKHPVKAPRTCVLGATVNPGGGGFLRDESGATRFWPVAVTRVELEPLTAMRDQLWAEAVHRYRAGEVSWLDSDDLRASAAELTEARRDTDPWEDAIREWLEWDLSFWPDGRVTRSKRPERLTDVSIAEILEHCLRLPTGRWGKSDKNRIGACLRVLGFTDYQLRDKHARVPRWRQVRGLEPALLDDDMRDAQLFDIYEESSKSDKSDKYLED